MNFSAPKSRKTRLYYLLEFIVIKTLNFFFNLLLSKKTALLMQLAKILPSAVFI